MIKIAELIERDIDEIAAVEALDNGKAFSIAKGFDASEAAACFRYYGGWADKIHGKVAEIDDSRLGYTRHEPIGVCGQIIPWNFPRECTLIRTLEGVHQMLIPIMCFSSHAFVESRTCSCHR